MFIWTFRFSQWSILLSPVILNFISETPCMLDTLLCTKISKTRSRVVLSMTSILLHARQSHITKMAKNPFSKIWRKTNTGLLKMIVSVLTTCHTQYTWDSGICIFLFDRTTLQVFVTYLTGALYVHPVWFYKHQQDNRVRSTQNAFSLPFAAICAPSGEMHNYCTPHIIKENFENFLIHRCNYILLSQVYCVWQVVKTLTIILNNSVYR